MLNENLVTDMMQGIAEAHNYSYTKMFHLKSLRISEHRRSYKPGDQVIIENDKLINSQGEVPTHEITLLEGTLADNRHQITVRNLSTNEVKIIET